MTNPTHYAVALKYDPLRFAAPYVVAKGQDEVALRIRAVAEENDIMIMENNRWPGPFTRRSSWGRPCRRIYISGGGSPRFGV